MEHKGTQENKKSPKKKINFGDFLFKNMLLEIS